MSILFHLLTKTKHFSQFHIELQIEPHTRWKNGIEHHETVP